MEQETMLKEIPQAFKLHSQHIDTKFEHIDQRFEKMDERLEQVDSKMDNMRIELEARMDQGFEHLGKKIDGVRADLTETQNTADFLLDKTAQHEKKLRYFSEPQSSFPNDLIPSFELSSAALSQYWSKGSIIFAISGIQRKRAM
ncbi:hypothetical protein [Oceanobacillus timonensis]|uniref:hypothetical protein n=1 Tax=Oceanobacillus timonensis TaxID=1926285 RepID=UPI0015C45103|nr:hypothetical protein [Oceanobacillus timonensis]